MNSLQFCSNALGIYAEEYLIRSYHVDVHRKLTLPKLCSFFQDIAGNHTVACGVGWEEMQNQNLFWVLSRLNMKVVNYPEWGDRITIRTWSNGLDGLLAIRHFQVLSNTGEELVKAISLWLVVNTDTRRLVRPFAAMEGFPLCDERLFESNPLKLENLTSPIHFEVVPVAFTETDMNRHMNNVSYIERIINSFDFEMMLEHQIKEFEINFLKEAIPGDRIRVEQQQTGKNDYLNSIVRENDGVEMVRTRIKWQKF
jgi:acyl-ACP thioesterase